MQTPWCPIPQPHGSLQQRFFFLLIGMVIGSIMLHRYVHPIYLKKQSHHIPAVDYGHSPVTPASKLKEHHIVLICIC